jgi:hypothetical protein
MEATAPDRSMSGDFPARLVREAVCEAMGSAVPEGFRPQAPPPTTVAAGTDEPERVAVQGVAADAAVFDTEAATSYGDSVESQVPEDTSWLERGERSRERWKELGIRRLGVPYIESDRERAKYVDTAAFGAASIAWGDTTRAIIEREAVRRGRLSRWQEQR